VIVVGVGCSVGCGADEVLALVDAALREAGVDGGERVGALATVDVKAGEPGLVEAARRRGWPVRTHTAVDLRGVAVPTPSEVVARHIGTPSVAEAAALLTSGAERLLLEKRRTARATCALARVPA
jgi:cobalt-precorrin 5A hydrolase/precorrin-3B C17-methyltransferase